MFFALLYVYTWVFHTWLLGRTETVDVGGLGGPGGPQKSCQKVWGVAPDRLEWFFGAAGAAQTPKIDDCQLAQKPCLKNPSVYVYVFCYKA